ncbi:MAG: Na+/H+ antiporter subunit E [Acinetobacter sp.]|nr:Na+/H+ antiporter subunit E [Acinetobacter sp.]
MQKTWFDRWFPHPFVSVLVALTWIILAASYSVQSIVMASILAIVIPRMVRPFVGRTQKIRWGLAVKLIAIVMWDILVSNIKIARLVLGSLDQLQPKWYRVPLESEHEQVNALLAMIITTTPGTVSAGIDQERRDILVHALSSDDEQADIQDMKQRYEALLMQIFDVQVDGNEQGEQT